MKAWEEILVNACKRWNMQLDNMQRWICMILCVWVIGFELSFDFRRDCVWSCEVHTIINHGQVCEVQGACTPMRIWWIFNSCSIRRRNIWVFLQWMHEAQDFALWVIPRLVRVYRDVQDQNFMCQCNEEGSMAGNQTMSYFCMKKYFYLENCKLPV